MKMMMCMCAVALMLVVGCSHNPGTYLFGEQTRIGFGEYGSFNTVQGMLLTDIPRENTTLEIEVDREQGISYDPATGTLKGIVRIKRTVGEQITGYLVDLAKVAPEAAIEYLRKTAENVKISHNGDKNEEKEAILAIENRLDAIEDVVTTPEVVQ